MNIVLAFIVACLLLKFVLPKVIDVLKAVTDTGSNIVKVILIVVSTLFLPIIIILMIVWWYRHGLIIWL